MDDSNTYNRNENFSFEAKTLEFDPLPEFNLRVSYLEDHFVLDINRILL